MAPGRAPLSSMARWARRTAGSTAYEYNRQATEDREEDLLHPVSSGEKRRLPRGKRPNYKPTALTWRFIVAQILLHLVAIGLVVWAEKAMPDSDSTAVIEPVPSQALAGRLVRAEFGKQFRRDNTSSVVETSRTVVDVPASTAGEQRTTPSTYRPSTPTNTASTALTPSTASADTSQTDGRSSTNVSGTISSTAPSVSISSPALSTSSDSSGGTSSASSRASGTAMTTYETSHAATTTMSAGKSPSGTGDSTRTSSGSLSSATPGLHLTKINGINISVDPTATRTITTLSTSVFTSKFTTTASSAVNITQTLSIPKHSTTFNVTQSTVIATSRTKTIHFTIPPTTVPISYTFTETLSSTTVYSSNNFQSQKSTSVVVTEVTSIVVSHTVISPTTVSSEVVEPTTITTETVVATTSEVPNTASETVIQTYVPYLSTGQTVITEVATVIIQPPETQAQTQAPVTVIGTSVSAGQVYTVVQTFAPQTKVVGDSGVEITQVLTPPPHTIVSEVGGTVVTNYIVVTPTPTTQVVAFNVESTIGGETHTFVQTQAPQTIVTSQGGTLVTLTTTPPPQTQVTVVGGTLTTVPVTSTSSGFQPISYVITTHIGGTSVIVATGGPTQVVTTINGTPVTLETTVPPSTYTTTFGESTSVVVTTPAPTHIVTTINGTPVTIDTTFPPSTYTTTFGGTQVTEVTATSPTATDPITLTLASTISGTLTTIVQTFPPTTYVTSVSGHLSTITSTPSPSTHLSTRPPSTTTFTSTSSSSQTSTAPPTAITSLVVTTKTYNLSSREYFIGTFLTPILAVALVIPLRIIDLNAKLYQPFNSLASPAGARGHEALTLQFTGLAGFLTPAMTLLQGHPVPFLTTLTVLSGSLAVPLAVEAVSLKLHGRCGALSARGCAAALGVSPPAAHALLALLAADVALLCLLLACLRRWHTGLHANPWSVAGVAALAARNPDVRIPGASDAAVRRAVAERTYALGRYEAPGGGGEEYGLVLVGDDGRAALAGYRGEEEEDEGEEGAVHAGKYEGGGGGWRSGAKRLPFMTLRYPWRVGFVAFLLGLLVLVAYYDYTLVAQVRNPTAPRYTRFHLFFDSHSFGIRFLFAGLGVVITFCWQAFFVAVATIVPYHAMATRTQPAARSVLVSRPTNAFYGLYAAARQRHAFYAAAALMAVLSEFLPVLLSNVPHKLTQVLAPTLACTRVSAAVLAAMAAVVAWSFAMRWPPMPVDPRCVAGALWYVCDSAALLRDCAGLAAADGRERDRRVRELGKRYYYGGLAGRRARIGVDVDPGRGDGVVTAYAGARREGAGSDPAPNEGPMGLRLDPPVHGGGGGYQQVRTGEDVVRAALGRRDDWENEDPAPNARG